MPAEAGIQEYLKFPDPGSRYRPFGRNERSKDLTDFAYRIRTLVSVLKNTAYDVLELVKQHSTRLAFSSVDDSIIRRSEIPGLATRGPIERSPQSFA